jgi:alpha-beta hydrolase superfamily lysophospholipase
MLLLYIYLMAQRPDLHPWHTIELKQEFSAEGVENVTTLDDYLALEKRLFEELDAAIYQRATKPSTLYQLNRYQRGSLADPTSYASNWNRTFILSQQAPRGAALLLHGLSDSPYSLRELARQLHQQGYYVIALRMPGHGTIPSALVNAHWQDMAAAVKLAARDIAQRLDPGLPFHVFGYSMGAAQAVNYTLDALQEDDLRVPSSLVLISPAIGVSGVAALAVWQSRLSVIPGLEKLAWDSIGPEYDPYKYSSFAINAGDLMYRLTLEIDDKLARLQEAGRSAEFPPTLAALSLVDATVRTQSVVTRLFDRLQNKHNELLIFDLNRDKQLEPFIAKDPIEDYRALLKRDQLTLNLTFLTNAPGDSGDLVSYRWENGAQTEHAAATGLAWPEYLYSLSHVALPFAPSDSLYGAKPAENGGLHIGMLASRGERGVLNVSANQMLRLRYNPFYHYLETTIFKFLDNTGQH